MRWIVILFFFTSLAVFAGCSGEIQGVIGVKGSEPHTVVTLTTNDNHEIALTGKLASELMSNFQNKMVKIKVAEIEKKNPYNLPEVEVIEIIESEP